MDARNRARKPEDAALDPGTWLVPTPEPSIVCTSVECTHLRRKCTRCGNLECVHTLDPEGVCVPCGIPRPRASTTNVLRTAFERGHAWGELQLLPKVPR